MVLMHSAANIAHLMPIFSGKRWQAFAKASTPALGQDETLLRWWYGKLAGSMTLPTAGLASGGWLQVVTRQNTIFVRDVHCATGHADKLQGYPHTVRGGLASNSSEFVDSLYTSERSRAHLTDVKINAWVNGAFKSSDWLFHKLSVHNCTAAIMVAKTMTTSKNLPSYVMSHACFPRAEQIWTEHAFP